jgi:hypothetical protein
MHLSATGEFHLQLKLEGGVIMLQDSHYLASGRVS